MSKVVTQFKSAMHHFDISFTTNSPPNYSGHSSGSHNLPPTASFGGMKARIAGQIEFIDDNCCLPDFDAINHVTNDIGSNIFEYTGHGEIHMLNAIGLHSSHIGQKSFNSTSRFPHLHLKNLLCVLLITKTSFPFLDGVLIMTFS